MQPPDLLYPALTRQNANAGTIGLAGASVRVNEPSDNAEDSFLEISCPQKV